MEKSGKPKQEKSNKAANKINEDKFSFLLPYINVFLFITVLFIIVYKAGLQREIDLIQGAMFVSILCLFGATGLQAVKKGFSWRFAVKLFLGIGFIMRIGYMLYTPYTTRAIDLGDTALDGYGHAAYILKIMVNGHLPETNWVQFYHPPLFHFLAACLCLAVNSLMNYTAYQDILEIAKIISCVASCWSLMLMPKICTELGLNEGTKAVATAIIAVLPSCYLMSARVNNDSLVTYFMILAILYTLRWYKEQSWKNTIGLGLAFGLGMMTKTSCGNIALFTGPLMLYVVYKRRKESKDALKEMAMKLFGFGAIAFPLGLWYTLRNYILFQQPFGYVVRIKESLRIYTGDVSWVKRFITFPVSRLFHPIYSDPWEEYNISLFVLKSSLFSEFKFKITPIIPKLLIFFNGCMIILSLAAMVYVIVKCKKNKMLSLGMPVLWGVIYSTFLYFNVEYPFGCTMDFRYIVPTAFLGAIFIGKCFDQIGSKKTRKALIYRIVMGTIIGGFGIISIFMFCMIGK
ncbi:MAG TPA: hypothetical protein DCW90_02190 [Lachnospiraceae bacterium]|nr:hypothetical protein [Lachnospiraceae bacterium]